MGNLKTGKKACVQDWQSLPRPSLGEAPKTRGPRELRVRPVARLWVLPSGGLLLGRGVEGWWVDLTWSWGLTR